MSPNFGVVNLMRFRVRRPFKWDGAKYQPGDVLEIPEGHPRINGMLMGRWIAYEAGDTPPTNSSGEKSPKAAGSPPVSSLEGKTPNEQVSQAESPIDAAVKAARSG